MRNCLSSQVQRAFHMAVGTLPTKRIVMAVWWYYYGKYYPYVYVSSWLLFEDNRWRSCWILHSEENPRRKWRCADTHFWKAALPVWAHSIRCCTWSLSDEEHLQRSHRNWKESISSLFWKCRISKWRLHEAE